MKRYVLISALVVVAVVLLALPAFSQDTKEPVASPTVVAEKAPQAETAPASAPVVDVPVVPPAASEEQAPVVEAVQSKDISIYGEVLAVNGSGNTLTVQYYDYDSDEEKTVELAISSDTKLENASSLSDIKKGDWVDASYGVVAGKNVAKAVMVEKEEAAAEAPAPATEQAPAE